MRQQCAWPHLILSPTLPGAPFICKWNKGHDWELEITKQRFYIFLDSLLLTCSTFNFQQLIYQFFVKLNSFSETKSSSIKYFPLSIVSTVCLIKKICSLKLNLIKMNILFLWADICLYQQFEAFLILWCQAISKLAVNAKGEFKVPFREKKRIINSVLLRQLRNWERTTHFDL